jgi:hypothetical protein
VKLHIQCIFYENKVFASVGAMAMPEAEAPVINGDKCEATRRAIVLAAAKGKP